MAKFDRCSVFVNKEKVKRLAKFKFGTLTNFYKKLNRSAVRFHQIINQPHSSKYVESLQHIAKTLDVDIEDIIL